MTGRRRLVLGLLAAPLALGAGLLLWAREGIALWLVVEDPLTHTDAVVVLAGDPDYERTRTAARFVLQGHARLLVLTGGESGPGDSAESLLEQALLLGVPRAQIRTERTSTSTRSSLIAIRPILEAEGVGTITLVTSPYHQRRAFLTARRALPEVEVFNLPAVSSWSPRGWWRAPRSRRAVLREYAALVYYGLRGWI